MIAGGPADQGAPRRHQRREPPCIGLAPPGPQRQQDVPLGRQGRHEIEPLEDEPPVTFGAVFASSLRAEAEETITDLVAADALVRAPAAGSVPNSAVRTP